MSEPVSSVDIIYNDIRLLEKNLSDLASQVTRIHRVIKIDEREGAVAKQQSETTLLRAVAANTEIVTALLGELQQDADNQDRGISYYRASRRRDVDAIRRRNAFLARLSAARQIITRSCSCGQHRGIMFVEKPTSTRELIGQKVVIEKDRLIGVVDEIKPGDIIQVKTPENTVSYTLDDVEIILHEGCPKWWWLAQSKLAFENGRSSEFRNSTPLDKYLSQLTIKTKGKAANKPESSA
jgi:hypothetical protein